MNALLVFDSSFLIRFKENLWGRKAFYPIEQALSKILSDGFGYLIYEVVKEIKDPHFVDWMKRITKGDNFGVMLNEEIQNILNGEVIPEYRRRQRGSIESHIKRSEYAADPVVISHAIYLKHQQSLHLLPVEVIVVTDENGMKDMCRYLNLSCADWDGFFDSILYNFMRKRCPGCYP